MKSPWPPVAAAPESESGLTHLSQGTKIGVWLNFSNFHAKYSTSDCLSANLLELNLLWFYFLDPSSPIYYSLHESVSGTNYHGDDPTAAPVYSTLEGVCFYLIFIFWFF